jgi:hypothetical protein
MNGEELCDEEKSYNKWVVDNLYYIRDNKDCIRVMKKLYMDGFAAGFVYKQQITAEEQLQK